MNDIESHVPRPNLPQNRVEVRPIVVEQTTRVMDGLCNLENILLENTYRVRIRDHQTRGPGPCYLPESLKVHRALAARGNDNNVESGHRCTGGVSSVGRIRDYHFTSPL